PAQQAVSSNPTERRAQDGPVSSAPETHVQEPAYAVHTDAAKAMAAPRTAESAAAVPPVVGLAASSAQQLTVPSAVAKAPAPAEETTTGRHFYQEYDAADNASEGQAGNGSSEAKTSAPSANSNAERQKPAHTQSYSEGSTEAALK